MENAAIYLRVSTRDQKEESQLEACKKFCEEKRFEVFGIYVDHARSAYKNVKRPAYNQILELVKHRKIKHVVVWAIDRWTRRGPEELKNSIGYLSAYDVQFHSAKEKWVENINLPGSMGMIIKDFFFNIMAWMAESESQRRSERVVESKKFQKAKKKGIVGRSELDTEVVQQVLEKLDEGMSYRKIRDAVTYKAKHGKIKHISLGKISEIAKMRS
jgi:DNA invertase Pin-like site-specific DNA recombinase